MIQAFLIAAPTGFIEVAYLTSRTAAAREADQAPLSAATGQPCALHS